MNIPDRKVQGELIVVKPCKYKYVPSHPDIIFDGVRMLRVLRTDARKDEDQYYDFDLGDFWLPATKIYSKPQKLSNRKELIFVIVAVVDVFISGVSKSKSRHRRVATIIHTLVKFFEYLWINEIYEIRAATITDFEQLARILASGHWKDALRFSSRVEFELKNNIERLGELIEKYSTQCNIKKKMGEIVSELIGTNLSSQEVREELLVIYESHRSGNICQIEFGDSDSDHTNNMGESILRQTFERINFLCLIDKELAIKFFPYPNSVKLAKSLGQRTGRTKNISAFEAGQILSEAYKWLYIYGPLTSELIAGLCCQVRIAALEGRKVSGFNLQSWLESAPQRPLLEAQLGVSILRLDGGPPSTFSVRKLLLTVYTACFVLVAVMNARRKNEIMHRKFGLFRGCASIVDEELGVFKANFYIEKTYQDYLEFYVNRTTWHAISLLEEIQASFDSVACFIGASSLDDLPEKERSLFGYFRFNTNKGINKKRCWFDFDSYVENGQTSFFLRRALGENYAIAPSAHMFRRLYALIFMYQHELPSLQALSQQLGHLNLDTTRVYCTDHSFREDTERIQSSMNIYRDRRTAMFASHLNGVRDEMAIVSDEKLLEAVFAIISGEQASGGYPVFIKKFYRKISGRLDFSELDLTEKADLIKNVLKEKGHVPKPMRHGQCMVGTVIPATGAKCKGENATAQTKNASPSLCGKCKYHYLTNDHIRNLNDDLANLKAKMVNTNLTEFERARARVDADNLSKIMDFHQGRMK